MSLYLISEDSIVNTDSISTADRYIGLDGKPYILVTFLNGEEECRKYGGEEGKTLWGILKIEAAEKAAILNKVQSKGQKS